MAKPGMTSGRGKDRSDLERTNCINATRTDCGTKLWAATCYAPGLGTARVTRFTAGADEPYEGILHVRVCGGRRGQPRLLPGTEPPFAPLRFDGVDFNAEAQRGREV